MTDIDETTNVAETVENEVVPKTPEVSPEAPPMPGMKISQIAPMAVMMLVNKFDIEKMGYTRHAEVAFVVVQVCCLSCMFFLYMAIDKASDDGVRLKIPEVKQMGQVVTPAVEQTTKDYDLSKWKEAAKQSCIGLVITGGIYYKWGTLMPLLLQLVMAPMQLFESPLVQIHILGKVVPRPFVVASPFGDLGKLMGGGEETPAVAETVADKKDK